MRSLLGGTLRGHAPSTTLIPYAAAAATAVLLAACTAGSPSPGPTAAGSPTASNGPSPSAPAPPATTTTPVPAAFPLAVVTGLTNLRATISVAEVTALATKGALVLPCDVTVTEPDLGAAGTCTPADDIAAVVQRDPKRVALLPPGLVDPTTKVLSITGTGPYGMFGPDLFGDTKARAQPYPIQATAGPGAAFDPEWAAYDRDAIWTMTNLGSLCADRGGATMAVKYGKGWPWVFDGGTARYTTKPPVDPPYAEPFEPVRPVSTGNAGAFAKVTRQSDVAIADHECPVVPDKEFVPQYGRTTVFSVPEEIVPLWRDKLGLDMLYLAANHLSDKGVRGIRSTLELLDKHKMTYTGLGMNLEEALEPAYVEVAGLTLGFVAFNDVAGVLEASATSPGVPWISEKNITEGVRRARAGGADMVFCTPQWWGGAEYHDDLWDLQEKQLGWFQKAGCDHVIGSGTHVAGPLLLQQRSDLSSGEGVSVTLVSPGNHFFGQGWWQETQEGFILDLSFRGETLVNVRLRPTVMISQAQPVLLDPQGDGQYVLRRVFKYSTLDPKA